MPTALDLRLRPKAQALIDKYGAPALLRSVPDVDYDTTTGTSTALASFDYPVNAVSLGVKRLYRMGELVRDRVLELMVGAEGLAVEPKQGDLLRFDGRDYRVLAVSATYSGEQVAFWTLSLEG